VAIVGAGLMGKWHAYYALQLKMTIVAIIDNKLSQAELLASQCSQAKAYDDFALFLQQKTADIVHICTPLDTHFSFAKLAINAGLHVIIEKPFATDINQTNELLKLAKEKDVLVFPVHQFSNQLAVKKLLTTEPLGEILRFDFVTCSAGAEQIPLVLINDEIANILPHPLSLFKTFKPEIRLGDIDWHGHNSSFGEYIFNAIQDGILLSIYIGMSSRPTRCELHIFGTKAKATLNLFHGYVIIEKGATTRFQKIVQPFKYGVQLLYIATKNLIRRLLQQENAYPGLKDLLAVSYADIRNSKDATDIHEIISDVAQARENIIGQFTSFTKTQRRADK
tara:strand:+ start:13036 stop:14043 length:1008 start_codon:yes stop_codon:yes gene_type:complete